MKIEIHTNGFSVRRLRGHKLRPGVYLLNVFGLAVMVQEFNAPDRLRQFVHYPRQELEGMRARFWGRMMDHHPRVFAWCNKHLPIDTLPF